ncbi:DUF3052 domain-containing protein [Aquimarina sp. SS2-1]|uniref:DUF3052 domain-containing protein n=1 Tax=Aquimarina besae TaxID=3342247 RepID=UPI00366F4A7B
MPAGYSGTPLAKKLGLKDGTTALFYNLPDYYWDLFIEIPKNIITLTRVNEGVKVDFIHIFCTSIKDLLTVVPVYKAALKKNGMLWVSWPKGSSGILTDLKRDFIRSYVIELGLVDVKVAAVDENWSGLKFVYRVSERKYL